MFNKRYIVTTSAIISLILSNTAGVKADESILEQKTVQIEESEMLEKDSQRSSSIENILDSSTTPTETPNNSTNDILEVTLQDFHQINNQLSNLLTNEQEQLLNSVSENENFNGFINAIVLHEQESFEEATELYNELLHNELILSPEWLDIIHVLLNSSKASVALLDTDFVNNHSGDLTEEVNTIQEERKSQITTYNIEIMESTSEEVEMLEKVLNANNASSAWAAVQDFKLKFPESLEIDEAFASAGSRMLSMGNSNKRQNNYDLAIHYYNLIINEERVSDDLRAKALNQIIEINDTVNSKNDENAMFQLVLDASSASQAWNKALEFKEKYPNSENLAEAFVSAGNRIYNMGRSSLNNQNYDLAKHYYELLLVENLVQGDLRLKIEKDYNNLQQALDQKNENKMYQSVLEANTASKAWTAAQNLKKHYPNSINLKAAFESAGNRILNMGLSSHRNRNYNMANHYYMLILDEDLIERNIQVIANGYNYQAENNLSIATEKEMYNAVLNAANASSAWLSAHHFKNAFPNSSLIKSSFESASKRIFDMGISNHKNKSYSTAIYYYELIVDEEMVNVSLREEASVYMNQAYNRDELGTVEDMYTAVVKAGNASAAWSNAEKLKTYFPNNPRVADAYTSAGTRIYSMGNNNHAKNNLVLASYYYDLLLKDTATPNGLKNIAEGLMKQIDMGYSYTTPNHFYGQSVSSNTATAAWNKANEGLSFFQNHPAIIKAVQEASYRLYNLGVNNHKNKNYSTALEYYEMLLENEYVDYTVTSRADSYKYLAERNYDLSNIIIRDTNYGMKLEDAVTIQMNLKAKPQMSTTNGGFRNANKNELLRYINPDKAQSGNDFLQYLILSGSSGVSVNDLNKELENSGVLRGQGPAFLEASKKANINEIYLIAHARLETGNGTSNLATGIEVNGRTVYNMFGIGAADHDAERLGAQRAYEEGWFTIEDSIIGGAHWISKNYINNSIYKQDTLYKMRWNPAKPGVHQYATDVAWAYKQTGRLSHIVDLAVNYDLILNFDYPLYD